MSKTEKPLVAWESGRPLRHTVKIGEVFIHLGADPAVNALFPSPEAQEALHFWMTTVASQFSTITTRASADGIPLADVLNDATSNMISGTESAMMQPLQEQNPNT